MPIPRIPDDLIYDIVDQIPGLSRSNGMRAKGATERELRAQLVACCLASKAFLVRARPLLYDAIVLHSVAHEQFRRRADGDRRGVAQLPPSSEQALSIAINPHRRLVRRVDVDVTHFPPGLVNDNLPALALATTLRSAPNTSELHILVAHEGEDVPYLPPLYHVITTLQPTLRILFITCFPEDDSNVVARSPTLFPLLATLPSLDTLTLSKVHIPSITSDLSFSFLLKTFDMMVEGPGSTTAFDALTANSSETLTDIRLGGAFKCDLSKLHALKRLTFHLIYDPVFIPDSSILERQVTLAVRDNIQPTIMSIPRSLKELVIADEFGTAPSTAFDADFFAKVPRSIAMVTASELRLEAEAILGLLSGLEVSHERRFSHLRQVYSDGNITGDTAAMITRFNNAGVRFRGVRKAEAKKDQVAQ